MPWQAFFGRRSICFAGFAADHGLKYSADHRGDRMRAENGEEKSSGGTQILVT